MSARMEDVGSPTPISSGVEVILTENRYLGRCACESTVIKEERCHPCSSKKHPKRKEGKKAGEKQNQKKVIVEHPLSRSKIAVIPII